MQGDKPKQYLPIYGHPIIHHTLSRICASPSIDGVIAGISDTDDWWPDCPFSHCKMLGVYSAGSERMDTVRNGLDYLLERQGAVKSDWALVHDAVRPCILQRDIRNLVDAAMRNQDGAFLGAEVSDTLKIMDEDDTIFQTMPRDGLCLAWTPQMFRIGDLIEGIDESVAHGVSATDEAMAVEAIGLEPTLVRGHPASFKVTIADDLDLMEVVLEAFR